MKYKFIILCLIFFISCKSEVKNKIPKKHNPHEQINQNLENEKAIELYFKGTENLTNGNFKLAQSYLKESFEIEKSPITLNELGTISLAENKYKEALSYFNESITLDKTYYPSHINKSRVFVIELDFEKAEVTLKNMIKECKSKYWTAYANFYLTTIYINNRENCEKIKKHLNKSQILKEDTSLTQLYLSIEKTVKKRCG
ncbi:hypothetical protein C7448_1129 [Tenacibaculum gallaicum]|uniref:Uncharacterized protein n=1 Tax=Tenacibaculum gallaicum TaxID=561505 RepID=A0A3E0HFG1_9FLAO|nr:tetratricopeptide repeat protein [Tenacibaculum gallaicum]REH43903.1 hypothetical protein C7448_1129 [Tenacibaculum gallaicum]